MFKKIIFIITGMLLLFVFIIASTFINSSTANKKPEYQFTEYNNSANSTVANEEKSEKEVNKVNKVNNVTEKKDRVNNIVAKKDMVEKIEKNINKIKEEPQNIEKKEDRHLNKLTKNTNILCLGIADKKLEMISIYSINKENKKSAGIFLPTGISLKVNGELLTLREIYQNYGVINLKKMLSQCLEVELPYHMVVDKQGLIELSEIIGPLYVENEYIDVPNLFVRPVSSKDDEILQALANEIIKPQMVKEIPELIKIFINNVNSDIGITELWELYKVFRNLNHAELGKIVLWGEKVHMGGKEYWFIDPYDWHNIIYEMTK